MTLHEIEETLHILVKRHPELDEAMLVTLLHAGGWEEKHIQEARLLFRAGAVGAGEAIDELPPIQEAPVLAPLIDVDHRLLEPHKGTVLQNKQESESLVSAQAPRVHREDLPHNLPLRPFETSEHIWPFSRYRDVFYGETEQVPAQAIIQAVQAADPVEEKSEEKVEEKPAEAVSAPPEPVAPPEPIIPVVSPRAPESALVQKDEHASVEVRVVTVPLSGGDEKLVVLASVMLLAILLLLGYMYGNGRL